MAKSRYGITVTYVRSNAAYDIYYVNGPHIYNEEENGEGIYHEELRGQGSDEEYVLSLYAD